MSQFEKLLTKKDVITKWMMDGGSKNFSEYESDNEYIPEFLFAAYSNSTFTGISRN